MEESSDEEPAVQHGPSGLELDTDTVDEAKRVFNLIAGHDQLLRKQELVEAQGGDFKTVPTRTACVIVLRLSRTAINVLTECQPLPILPVRKHGC